VYYHQWRLHYAVAKTYSLLGRYRTTIKSPPADLFRHVICRGETFQCETLFHCTLDALLLWLNMRQSVPEITVTFLQIFCKPPLQSWTGLYFQKANEKTFPMIYCPYRNNLNFSHKCRIHFSSKRGLENIGPMETNNPKIHPSPEARGPLPNTRPGL